MGIGLHHVLRTRAGHGKGKYDTNKRLSHSFILIDFCKPIVIESHPTPANQQIVTWDGKLVANLVRHAPPLPTLRTNNQTEPTMTTRRTHQILALIVGSTLSAICLSTVVVGMQRPEAPRLYSIELPTVTVVAHRAAAPQATAQANPVFDKNS
jgi:hypothetical protein